MGKAGLYSTQAVAMRASSPMTTWKVKESTSQVSTSMKESSGTTNLMGKASAPGPTEVYTKGSTQMGKERGKAPFSALKARK